MTTVYSWTITTYLKINIDVITMQYIAKITAPIISYAELLEDDCFD